MSCGKTAAASHSGDDMRCYVCYVRRSQPSAFAGKGPTWERQREKEGGKLPSMVGIHCKSCYFDGYILYL